MAVRAWVDLLTSSQNCGGAGLTGEEAVKGFCCGFRDLQMNLTAALGQDAILCVAIQLLRFATLNLETLRK